MRRLLILATGLSVVLAAPASAAYAPRLEAKLEPATPNAASALVLTLRQEPGETANRREVIRYPPAFRFNPAFDVSGCPPDREAASDCPDSSRIGAVSVQSEFGEFSGPLYLTDDFRFVIFLRGFAGLVQQKVEGYFRVAEDGYVETIIDGLPDVRATFAQVRSEPGTRSLVLAPARCGTYTLEGRFTSQSNEQYVTRAPVTIAGCPSRPAVGALRARVRNGRITVSWTLTDAGRSVTVDLDRGRKVRRAIRWRRLRSVSTNAVASDTTEAVFEGRGGRRLAPGRYRVTVTTRGSDGALGDSRRTEVTVR